MENNEGDQPALIYRAASSDRRQGCEDVSYPITTRHGTTMGESAKDRKKFPPRLERVDFRPPDPKFPTHLGI